MHNKEILDIFFDLDHTLWDFDKNSGLAFERVFNSYKIELPLIEFLREYEPINLVYWKKYRDDQVTKEQLRRGRLTETFDLFQMEFPVETIDALAISYINELPVDNHLLEHTLETLDYLVEKYKLHIITNGFQEVQHLKLNNSGIIKYFDTVTTSEEVGLKKPHPSVFQTAMKKAATIPQKSIMIGDSFEADILGAYNVGMHTLFFNYRKETLIPPHFAIHKLSEIKDYL